ncbi:signal peptidase II [Paludibaculum fermentans]|uniref:Lipoprotein signal peptidase n=1 Tax=Paludibaculum fermentans TaxID=1473598 RepID=A0A7S7NW20_PALFE|nr:signal peptidase II [Paludibaculum fermentans]QOY90829.1 signal peptidase II [Paludibaculum fermentans]
MQRWWPFGLTLLILALDRATKHLIETKVQTWDTVAVIPGLFQIIHTRNTGIAFSMFADSTSSRGNPLLVLFSVAVMILVTSLLWTACKPASKEHWTLRAALALVLGGAVGNLFDRIIFGSVTDFLDFFWSGHHFPIFNLADSAITVGAALLLLNLWMVRRPAESREN